MSIYDICSQERRLIRIHVGEEVFCYLHPKIHGREFLEGGDVGEHLLLWLNVFLAGKSSQK